MQNKYLKVKLGFKFVYIKPSLIYDLMKQNRNFAFRFIRRYSMKLHTWNKVQWIIEKVTGEEYEILELGRHLLILDPFDCEIKTIVQLFISKTRNYQLAAEQWLVIKDKIKDADTEPIFSRGIPIGLLFHKRKNWQPIYVPHRGTWSDNGPLKYFLLQIPQIWSLRYWHLWPHGHDSNQWRHVATIAIIYTRIYPLIRGRDIFFFLPEIKMNQRYDKLQFIQI